MSSTGLPAFDSSLQKTHEWLNQIMEELGADTKQKAYVALRAVLHSLRDRLTIDEAAHLGAQLPLIIRGIYYEGWKPAQTPLKLRSRQEFLQHVRDHLQVTPDPAAVDFDPEATTRAVFRVIHRQVSEGEVDSIKLMLQEEIADLWPASATRH